MKRKKSTLWLPEAMNKLTLYLFLFSMMIFLFYFAGNFQKFTDKTQIILLTVFRYAALLFIVTGSYNLLINIMIIIRKKYFYVLRFIVTLLGEIFITTLLVGVSMLLNVVKGG